MMVPSAVAEEEEIAPAPLAAMEEANVSTADDFVDFEKEMYAEVICPICLDTYDDARTLNCGHSMCWACIEQMRIASK